jgi:SAM-dependent methyltransferase
MSLMSVASGLYRRFRPAAFRLPEEPFGAGDTERCIEIPWALSCYRGERRVLDVGYANAEDRYLNKLISLGIPELYGLDRIARHLKGIIPVVGDIRKTEFPDGFFDLVLCISTIEHIGRDNTIYFQQADPGDESGDIKAIQEMARITRNGGKIALTAPYGRLCDYGWFIHYDKDRWRRLIKASNCRIKRENYYIYIEGWRSCEREELEGVLYTDNNAPAAAGVVCTILQK